MALTGWGGGTDEGRSTSVTEWIDSYLYLRYVAVGSVNTESACAIYLFC